MSRESGESGRGIFYNEAMQELIVILIVAACALWLARQAYRYLYPRPGGKTCGGGCCDGNAKAPASSAQPGERVMMISSDDLRARLKARKS